MLVVFELDLEVGNPLLLLSNLPLAVLKRLLQLLDFAQLLFFHFLNERISHIVNLTVHFFDDGFGGGELQGELFILSLILFLGNGGVGFDIGELS